MNVSGTSIIPTPFKKVLYEFSHLPPTPPAVKLFKLLKSAFAAKAVCVQSDNTTRRSDRLYLFLNIFSYPSTSLFFLSLYPEIANVIFPILVGV